MEATLSSQAEFSRQKYFPGIRQITHHTYSSPRQTLRRSVCSVCPSDQRRIPTTVISFPPRARSSAGAAPAEIAGAAEEGEDCQNPARTLAMDDAAAGADDGDGGGGGGTGFAAEPRTKGIRHRRRHRQLGGCHPLGYCYCHIVAWRLTAI